jgi:hypothetical protein
VSELALAVFASETGTHLVRPPATRRWYAHARGFDEAAYTRTLTSRGYRFLSSSQFPPLLRAIHDPPPGLFVRGDAELEVLARPAVAVVGARACSGYGASAARMLGRELAAAGLVVVSGLARGVDAEAHRGALDAGGLTVAWVCDNAGRELVADLLLVERLLADGLASSVTLHLKPVPYFVSDATARDLVDCLDALARAGAADAVDRLRATAAAGRLRVAADAFWCAPLELRDAPPGLAGELRAADLVVVKGDLNYRKLVGDAAWPAPTPFADAVQLPGPVAALRVLKSDVLVGVEEATVAALDASSPGWRTNGSHALLQVHG